MALSTVREAKPSASEQLERRAFLRALSLFREAARRVPAYKDFLRKAKVKPERIRTRADFASLPLTDKQNYISAYPLKDLSWDGDLTSVRHISSSSGSTGIPFYWPRGKRQELAVSSMFQRVFEDIFETKRGETLCVNSFALGAWIAGMEFLTSVKTAADLGSKIVLVTPGIEKQTAVDEIKRLSPFFGKVIIAGYPPFVKDILEYGSLCGIDWKKFDVRLSTGGEAISERWRDHVLSLIGKKDEPASIINMYGMAETGIVAFETPLSIALRRQTEQAPEIHDLLLNAGEIGPLYQYDPLLRYFEALPGDSLALTADAGLPLIRYDTRDHGGLVSFEEARKRFRSFLGKERKYFLAPAWRLPFVYLFGRKDLSISLYALNIYVENIKHALELSKFSSHLSGLFTMEVGHTENLDQKLLVSIELKRGEEPNGMLSETLTEEITTTLCQVNGEYAKLHASIGDRAKPQITLLKLGEIQTVPGRKHKWIRRA